MIWNKVSQVSQFRVKPCFNSTKTFFYFLVFTKIWGQNQLFIPSKLFFWSSLKFGGKVNSSFLEDLFFGDHFLSNFLLSPSPPKKFRSGCLAALKNFLFDLYLTSGPVLVEGARYQSSHPMIRFLSEALPYHVVAYLDKTHSMIISVWWLQTSSEFRREEVDR